MYIASKKYINELHTSGRLFNPDITEVVNRKRFKASDIDLTYRQINNLSSSGILPENRNSEKEWRKFSTRELIYLRIIGELRKYGLKDKQLNGLRDCFFGTENQKSIDILLTELFDENRSSNVVVVMEAQILSDILIELSLQGKGIYLGVDYSGGVSFYDDSTVSIILDNLPSLILLNISLLVREHYSRHCFYQGSRSTISNTVLSIIKGLPEKFPLSKKEVEVLYLIRDKKYTEITVKKKDDQIFTLHADRVHNCENEISVEEVMKILTNKDYIDLNVKRRDGKFVRIESSETFKPKE